jgi:hypothetical protein
MMAAATVLLATGGPVLAQTRDTQPPPPGAAAQPMWAPPAPRPAVDPERVPIDAEPIDRHLGVGYKIGNGLGFLGADIVVSPVPHLALDLQANYFSTGGASGFGVAPGVQVFLWDKGRSTPYFSAGYVHLKLSLNDVTATGSGYFGNFGYEWKWATGVGILLGGGLGYLNEVSATDGFTTVTRAGGVNFNIEAGVRFMFI